MAVLQAVRPDISGGAPGFESAATGGDTFANDGRTYVHIKNGNVAARTVTFDSPGTCSFDTAANAGHDLEIVVAANSEQIVGPFPIARFNDGDGVVAMEYTAVVDLEVAVLRY